MKSIILMTPFGFKIEFFSDGQFLFYSQYVDDPFPHNWNRLAICNWLIDEGWALALASDYQPMEIEV